MVDTGELSVDSLKTAIGDILKSSELSSLTSRIVRNNLEERFNVSLKHRKKEIDELLMAMIEESQENTNEDSEDSVPTNGAADGKQESESEEKDKTPVTKKARKEKKSKKAKSGTTNKNSSKKDASDSESEEEDEDNHDDAEIARKLHESERGLRKRKQPTKRAQKSPAKKEAKPKGEKSRSGFGKLMVLSPELAEIIGSDQLPRSEVVKKMWQIIRERNLTDPKDKRFHICDPQLLKVFGTKRVRTFSMMKYLKQHIKDPALIG